MAFPILDQTVKAQVSAVYVAYFGRAPDPQGLDFWIGQHNDGIAAGKTPEQVLNDISESFRLSEETQDNFAFFRFPNLADQNSIANFVNQVFNNLFNRDAEGTADDVETGLGFWTNEIQSRLDDGVNIGDILIDIISGAQDGAELDPDGDGETATFNDSTTIANKIEVAQAYADAFVNTAGAEWTADDDLQSAQDIIDPVDDTAESVTAQSDAADQIAADDAATGPVEGQTFTLTGDPDTLTPNSSVESDRPTAGDDLFRGPTDGRFTSDDVIDGADGTDIVEAVVTPANGANAPTVRPALSNVEEVHLDAGDQNGGTADSLTFDGADSTGLNEVRIDNLGDLNDDGGPTTTDTATIRGISTDVLVGFKDAIDPTDVNGSGADADDGTNDNVDSALTVNFDGVDGDSDSASLVSYSSTLGTFTVNAVETLGLASEMGANTIWTLNADSATNLNITGTESLKIDSALAGSAPDITNIDASNNTGGVDLTTGALGDDLAFDSGDADDILDAGAFTNNLTANTGPGDDTVTLGSGDDTVSTGIGDDRVDVGGNLTADDSIDGGDGSGDVVGAAADELNAIASGDAVNALSNFEGVAVTNELDETVDVSAFGNAANRVILEGGGNGGTLDGLSNGVTVESTLAGDFTNTVTLTIPGATDANTPDDNVNLKLNADLIDGANHTVDFAVDGINTVNINAQDSDNEDEDTDGSEGYTVMLGSAANVGLIDASESSRAVTLDMSSFGGSQGVEYRGGDGVDNFTGTGFADIIRGNGALDDQSGTFMEIEELDGGAGNDQIEAGTGITLAQGGDGADIIDLGEGEDGTTDNQAFDGLFVGSLSDFQVAETDGVRYSSDSELSNSNTASSGTFGTDSADKISFFNLGQDTPFIDGGVGNTGEAAVLDVGTGESTNNFTNGALINDGSGNAAAASSDQGIYQVALALGDEDETTLSSATDLLDENAVLTELETANGETGVDLNGAVSLTAANDTFDDLNDMAFTVYGPDGAFAIYSFKNADGTDGTIDAGDLSLVGIGSDGNVNDEFGLTS